MRSFIEFDDARLFCDRALPLMMEREAENCLLIGIANKLSENIRIDWTEAPAVPLMCGVESEGRMTAVAIMAPPHRLILTGLSSSDALLLAGKLHEKRIGLPGVVGPPDACAVFVDAWARVSGIRGHLTRNMRIHQLDQVIAPPAPRGRFQAACMPDSDLVIRWTSEFWNEVGERVHAQPQTMRRRIAERNVFLWLDPLPVSMAAYAGPTPNGIRVGMVYTPPEHRGKGYATAVTAAISQHLLDRSYRCCYLFTDIANETSNHIYARIGYRPVCEYRQYDFPPVAWAAVS